MWGFPHYNGFLFTPGEKCNLNFANKTTNKAHIREEHKKETQKVFVSDAIH